MRQAITIERLGLTGAGVTEDEIRAAMARAPGPAPIPPAAPPAGGAPKAPGRRKGRRRPAPRPKVEPWSPDRLRALLGLGRPPVPDAGCIASLLDPFEGMNRGERIYAEELERRRLNATLLRWDFEPETFKLAPGTRYTPDFRIIRPGGSVAFVDVKGRKGERFWVEEDAWLKMKLMAHLHPYPLYAAWRNQGGEWRHQLIGSTGDERKGETP